MGNFAEKKIQ